MNFSIVAAKELNGGIGYKSSIPWKNKDDISFFKNLTYSNEKNNVVIMGRVTWDSLNRKKLKGRINLVISKTLKGDFIFKTLDKALIYCNYIKNIGEVFVIGGEKLYNEAITSPFCKKIYLNIIKENHICDTFFPKIKKNFKLFNDEEKNNVIYQVYYDIIDYKSEEYQYLNLINNILRNGNVRIGRNGKVISSFGIFHTFNLEDGFPILTTKSMFFRGIVEELLFFLRGETNTNKLEEKSIKIWKGNTSKEFLKLRNLNYEEGDMGPMYGFIWRHYGANYKGMKYEYKNEGLDQIKVLLEEIENNPTSRRLLLTSYEPTQIENSVLPPCHGISIQFYVRGNYLDCFMHQRSADVGLGYPFNISSYSLLLIIISSLSNKKAGKLTIVLGDAHIYEEHIESLKNQTKRIPYIKPTLEIKKDFNSVKTIEEKLKFIEELKYEDFTLKNYNHHSYIKMEMKS